MNPIREKVLLLLLAGAALACSHRPGQQWRILEKVSREWQKIDKKKLRKEINYLYRVKLVIKEKNSDGSINITFTEKGKLRALNYKLSNIKNKKEPWDKKWRMVAFDMPEKFKRGRDALRHKLKEIGFCELQKSVFICPYNCINEISLFVKFYNLDKYVRLGVLEFIDNEHHFKKIFKLN